ncbi:MAG: hypothetical protein GX548_03170 [Lentisphaerae bacterium]|nr:hypothetical protein [Lentisphaerota bacterium]
MKKAFRIVLSLAVSGAILWLLFREAEKPARDVAQALWGMGGGIWAAYALGQVVQGWLRAVRYRLLLQGAGVDPLPGRGRMFGVTLARNMFVDMLPARAGELMYWALLNRGEKVNHEDCASSMALSIWFDFLALVAVLGFALGVPMLDAQGRVLMLWGLAVVLAVTGVGWVALFHGPDWAVRLARHLPERTRRWKSRIRLEDFLGRLAASFAKVRGGGVLMRSILLSVGIRAVKYAGMGVAFYGVARGLRPALAALPVWQVLVGLISGEGGAALPVPTFLSMGTYEAAGAGALGLTGVAVEDAGLVMLGAHVVSQLVDYAMGGLGLLGLLWGRPAPGAAGAADSGKRRFRPVGLICGCAAVLAVATGAAWAWRMQKKGGAKEAPGAGVAMSLGREDRARLSEAWAGRSGFIVWSSTVHGNHELVRMDWPSGELSRLTDHPHVDRSPKISPDGRRVAFARSRQAWVSFRNNVEWDLWMLDLETGGERRLAEYGAQPCWTGDGTAVVFQRRGREVVQVDVETGEEVVLLGERARLAWTTPSLDPVDANRVAVTVRGGRRSTSFFALPDGDETRVAGGCQLAFAPDGKWLVLVESGGRMKNRICRVDRDGKTIETLLDMPLPWSHEYFPRVSNDGALLVFGAAREGHEHDTADYEIFLWRIGDAPENAARISFHTGNDQWPDIWVHAPGNPPVVRK